MVKPPLDTSFIWGRHGLPDIVLEVDGDIFKAEGEHPVPWSIFAKIGPHVDEAQTRIVVNGKRVADIEIHARVVPELVQEVQEVASAIVWSGLRALHMGIDRDSPSSSKAEKVIEKLREWFEGCDPMDEVRIGRVSDELEVISREYHIELDKIKKEEGGIIKAFRKWLEVSDLGTEDRGIVLALEAYRRQAFGEIDRLCRRHHVVIPREGDVKEDPREKIPAIDLKTWLSAYGAAKPFAAKFVRAAYRHIDRLIEVERLAKRGIGKVVKPEVEVEVEVDE